MSQASDRRDSHRIFLRPGFGISFTLKGYAYHDVRITNLSPAGCFALVGVRAARLFERGALLEGLLLLHPELPKAPILATVVYVLGARPSGNPLSMTGIGIQFLGMDEGAQRALDTWLCAAKIAQQA